MLRNVTVEDQSYFMISDGFLGFLDITSMNFQLVLPFLWVRY